MLVDLDNDGRRDVVGELDAGELGIWRNSASGLLAAQTLDIGGSADAMTSADLDGDGGAEIIAVGSRPNTNSPGGYSGALFIVKLGATGATTSVRDLPARGFTVAAGDVDGDGDNDVVVGHTFSNQPFSSVLMNTVGALDAPIRLATGRAAHVAIANIDGNGPADLVVNGDFVTWYPGASNGLVAPRSTDAWANRPIVRDLDGDGDNDIVSITTSSVSITLGNGDGTFVRSELSSGTMPRDVAVEDVDRDGKLDLVVLIYGFNYATYGSISVFWGDGAGGFGSPTKIGMIGAGDGSLAIGDIDGDCRPDIVVGTPSYTTHNIVFDGNTQTIKNTGSRTFGAPVGISFASRKVLLGDLDGDAVLDLVVEHTNDHVTSLHGTGTGQFVPVSTLSETKLHALDDIDHDGKLDLVVNSGVRLGLGNGTFAPRAADAISGEPVGDVDGDGNLDFHDSLYTLAFGQGDGTVKRRIGLVEVGTFSADVTGDGRADLMTITRIRPQICPN